MGDTTYNQKHFINQWTVYIYNKTMFKNCETRVLYRREI